ncbi:MAG: type II toxin-antitoxin system RelE/ParE family toxin [Actinomycetes bacterium]|nr:type II toxin-antitoxin system RelE/ParE family toxin [Actinomycetes bacterium]
MRTYKTAAYNKWLSGLKDADARRRILVRVRRLELGNTGDSKALGAGLNELRIDYGPGYRVYYGWHGCELVLLLAGGDKSSQNRDVVRARELLISAIAELKEGEQE